MTRVLRQVSTLTEQLHEMQDMMENLMTAFQGYVRKSSESDNVTTSQAPRPAAPPYPVVATPNVVTPATATPATAAHAVATLKDVQDRATTFGSAVPTTATGNPTGNRADSCFDASTMMGLTGTVPTTPSLLPQSVPFEHYQRLLAAFQEKAAAQDRSLDPVRHAHFLPSTPEGIPPSARSYTTSARNQTPSTDFVQRTLTKEMMETSSCAPTGNQPMSTPSRVVSPSDIGTFTPIPKVGQQWWPSAKATSKTPLTVDVSVDSTRKAQPKKVKAKPPTFSGEVGESARTFLQRCRDYFRFDQGINGVEWSDSCKRITVPQWLRGKAARWWDGSISDVEKDAMDYQAFEICFRLRYQPKRNPIEVVTMLTARPKYKGETFDDYSEELTHLVYDIRDEDKSDNLLLEAFRTGLGEPYSGLLRNSTARTLRDAVTHLRECHGDGLNVGRSRPSNRGPAVAASVEVAYAASTQARVASQAPSQAPTNRTQASQGNFKRRNRNRNRNRNDSSQGGAPQDVQPQGGQPPSQGPVPANTSSTNNQPRGKENSTTTSGQDFPQRK